MNSFRNVVSACVDKVKVRDGAGRAHVVSKADGKRAAEGRLQLEPASAVWTSLFLCCNLANTQCLMFCMHNVVTLVNPVDQVIMAKLMILESLMNWRNWQFWLIW